MWCARLDRDKTRATTMNVQAIHTETSTAHHAIRMGAHACGIRDSDDNRVESFPPDNQHATGFWNRDAFRQNYPYALFNKSPLQLRQIGALGGKAYARNQRARRALTPTLPAATPLRSAPRQSTAEAISALDIQFPWLRCAEKRRSRQLS
jgi:hypothetical protein